MTCVVGIVHSDKSITFAADSAGASEYAIMTTSSKKIFKKKDLIFGVAGSWRQLQLLHYALEIPERTQEYSDEAYITLTLVDAIRTCFQERSSSLLSNNQEKIECSILIGYRGSLYRLNEDFGMLISHTYDVIGSGDDVAKGALYATNHFEPSERAIIALKAAAEHTAFVRQPFLIETLPFTQQPFEQDVDITQLQKAVRSMLTVKRMHLGDLQDGRSTGEFKEGHTAS